MTSESDWLLGKPMDYWLSLEALNEQLREELEQVTKAFEKAIKEITKETKDDL